MGSSPVAPAFVTPSARPTSRELIRSLEVGREGWAWSRCDDRSVVLPEAVEEACKELAPLGGRGFDLEEAAEVGEDLLGFGEFRVERWLDALEFLLDFFSPGEVLP